MSESEVIESPKSASSDLYNALDKLKISDYGQETFETAAPEVLARRKIVHRRPRPGDPPKEQCKPAPRPPPPKQTYSRGSSGSTEAVNGGRGAARIPYHSDSDSDDSITSPEVISAPTTKPNNKDNSSPTKAAAVLEAVDDTNSNKDDSGDEVAEENKDSSMLNNGKTKATRSTAGRGKPRGKTTTVVAKGRAAFEATGENQ